MTLPTGEQFVLETSTASGDLRATITAVAAGIRTLTINGIDLASASVASGDRKPHADAKPDADGTTAAEPSEVLA